MEDEHEDPDLDEIDRKMSKNSRIVSAACNRYFAKKGMRCYDLKGNEINPLTKKLITKKPCKPTSKD